MNRINVVRVVLAFALFALAALIADQDLRAARREAESYMHMGFRASDAVVDPVAPALISQFAPPSAKP